MHAFDYLAVLISIVLGLALTQLLSAVARWLELRAEIKPYTPAALWAATLLLTQVQTWWSMFGLRAATSWSFLQFAAVLMQPALLFLLSALALPGPGSSERDLKANFYTHRRWLFGLFLALLAASLLKDRVVAGHWPGPGNLAFHAGFATCAILAFVSRRDSVQIVTAAAALGLILAYIGLLFANLA